MKKSLLTLLTIPLFLLPKKVSNSKSPLSPEERMKYFYEQKIKSLFPKLEEIKYKRDAEVYGWNYWQSPEETEKLKTGDCEDKSLYFQDLLNKELIETKLVWGKIGKARALSHMWLEYSIDDKRYLIECSGNGKIISRDTLNPYYYAPLGINDLAKSKIHQYESKNNTRLNIKYTGIKTPSKNTNPSSNSRRFIRKPFSH